MAANLKWFLYGNENCSEIDMPGVNRKNVLFCLTIAGFLFVTACRLGIPNNPTDEQSDWSNAGVEGEIPDYPVGVNVMDYNAKGNGVTDDTQAILDAVEACPEDMAVFLPAGTYLTTGTISIRKSIVLRGAGPKMTTIIHNHGGDAIHLGILDKEFPYGPEISRAGIEALHIHTMYPFSKGLGKKI